jgi:GT2 family glycosyltransferase
MPFAGDLESARVAIESLLALRTRPGDELILVDNVGVLAGETVVDRVTVLAARGEQSPGHARNAGAEHARAEWVLFLDADCVPSGDLLDAYFSEPVGADVGALAGDVVAAPDAGALAARYAAARGMLSQDAHLAHSHRPRAVAANLLVRRAAFDQVAGFYEGLRAAEDTDFSWRLQEAGWKLEHRPGASVQHRHRATVGALRRQWRSYAAGRAWLSRRYDGFRPEPAISRVLRRLRHGRGVSPVRAVPPFVSGRLDRARFFALDAVLAGDELAGFALSNRPRARLAGEPAIKVVLVADRFPTAGDPLVELARTIDGARVEAAARPETIDVAAARVLRIDYREDDGAASRALALARLAMRHPVRCLGDALGRSREDASLATLAPAAGRLARDRAALVQALGSVKAQEAARRLAALAGTSLRGDRRS